METLWTALMGLGIPSAIIGGIVSLCFRRLEKRQEAERRERERQEAKRREYETFQVKMLTAATKLCEANAIALQNGKCNGETHAALDYLMEVKHEQRDFLVQQGINHLF